MSIRLVYCLGLVAIVYDTYFLMALGQGIGALPGPSHLGRYALLDPLIIAYIIWVGAHSLLNLWEARKQAGEPNLKSILTSLFVVTIPPLLGGLYLGAGPHFFGPNLPAFLGDILIGSGVAGLGYTIARYRALIEGRTIERDMLYNLLGIGIATTCYGLTISILHLYLYREVNLVVLALIVICAIVTHALVDGARTALDRIFYHKQFQQLRAHLRNLAREVGAHHTLEEQLNVILHDIQRLFHNQKGLITLRRNDVFVVVAPHDTALGAHSYPLAVMTADTIMELSQLDTEDLQDMALLVPLHHNADQIGAILLSAKEGGSPYVKRDLESLETLADLLATLIHYFYQKEENTWTINDWITDFCEREQEVQQEIYKLQQQIHDLLFANEQKVRRAPEGNDEEDFANAVERCLQQLHDFGFLGEQTLAQLQVVNERLESDPDAVVTKLDRGKVLQNLLLQALDKLRPEEAEPKGQEIPPRRWHLFLVSRDRYVCNRPIREICINLYIAEPTFHRIRRRAVRSIANTLAEMEQQAQQRAEPR